MMVFVCLVVLLFMCFFFGGGGQGVYVSISKVNCASITSNGVQSNATSLTNIFIDLGLGLHVPIH